MFVCLKFTPHKRFLCSVYSLKNCDDIDEDDNKIIILYEWLCEELSHISVKNFFIIIYGTLFFSEIYLLFS